MRYLIDTHVCLWAISDSDKLSNNVAEILSNPNNEIYISKISLFEIVIKIRVGKLPDFKVTIPELIKSILETGFKLLPIETDHFASYALFEFSDQHRDPFDRLILATAKFEELNLITKDEKLNLYNKTVNIIW